MRRTADVVAAGSVKSEWILLRDAANSLISATATADSAYDSSTVGVLTVPNGATRAIFRHCVDAVATAVTIGTTVPVIRIMGVDNGGVPTRIDATDFTATGVSLGISSIATNNPAGQIWVQSPTGGVGASLSPGSLYRWGTISSSYDLLGAERIFVQRTTAANHTVSTNGIGSAIAVLFLN